MSVGLSDVISFTRAPLYAQIQGTHRRAARVSVDIRCDGVASVAMRIVLACSSVKAFSSSAFPLLDTVPMFRPPPGVIHLRYPNLDANAPAFAKWLISQRPQRRVPLHANPT